MKKFFILILLFLVGFWSKAQMSPQSKKITNKYFPELDIEINTPAFQKKKGFTNYEELMGFLNQKVSKYPNLISLKFIGTSQEGKEIPQVTLTNLSSKETKIRCWMQGGLHGNEPASTEGVLMLIDQLLSNDTLIPLLDKLEIAIVPMANIDGYEIQNRYASNGLDLNRDQTKLACQESVYLKQAFSQFDAFVALDFHEYRPYRRDYAKLSEWGVTSSYDVMFLYSGNLNVPKELRDFTQGKFVNPAKQKMAALGFTHHDYFSTTKDLGELQINQGSVNARSSATSYALTNCVSSLIEVRGVGLNRTSFKRRTFTTYSIGLSYLKSAVLNETELMNIVKNARTNPNKEAVVKSIRKTSKGSVKLIDVSTTENLNIELVINDAWYSNPTLTRKKPTAYLIKKDQKFVIEKLKILGLQLDSLKEKSVIAVERYVVTKYNQDAEEYEGARMQKVSTDLNEITQEFPKGTVILYLNQPKGNIAIEVLEPEASNSFVSFDLIKTELGAELPIYRYVLPNKL